MGLAVCLVSVVFEVVRTRQLRVLNPTRQISGFIMERDLCFLDAPPPKKYFGEVCVWWGLWFNHD